MKHISTLSKTTIPARATNLLELTQLGTIVGIFATAFGTISTAFNTFTTAYKTKGKFDE